MMTCAIHFPPRAWVRLQNLSKSPHLNGQVGQIIDGRPDPQSGRVSVAVHAGLTFKEQECFLNSFAGSIARRFLELPWYDTSKNKLLKPENLEVVPRGEMVSAVRYASEGELQEGAEQFEELPFPASHPLFKQTPNCPIAAKLGCPLIQTKLAIQPIGKLKTLQELGKEREWCQNQPGLFLRAEIGTGLAPPGEADFVGPVLVCRPAGGSWTPRDAKELHVYFNHLMRECYGGRGFDPERMIGAAHWSSFLASLDPPPASQRFVPVLTMKQPAAAEGMLPLFQAAFRGHVPTFAAALAAVRGGRDLAGARHFGVSLAQAAIFGGRGEIFAALLTHEGFDAEAFEAATDVGEHLFKFAIRACEKGQSGDDFEVRKWIVGLCLQMRRAREVLKLPSYALGDAGMAHAYASEDYTDTCLAGNACFLPKPGEFLLGGRFHELPDLDLTVSNAYPFPCEEFEAWRNTDDYQKLFLQFGDGAFAALHCDLELLKRMYVLACDIHSEDVGSEVCSDEPGDEERTEAQRAEFRNIGWTLFFRASKDAMLVHAGCLQKAVALSTIPGRQCKREMMALPRACWDRLGTWVD